MAPLRARRKKRSQDESSRSSHLRGDRVGGPPESESSSNEGEDDDEENEGRFNG